MVGTVETYVRVSQQGNMKKTKKQNKKMNNAFDITNMKYVPKHYTSFLFFILFAVVFILFWGRKSDLFQIDFLLQQMPTFYQHISNFSLSYLFFAGIGYFWLLMGMKFRYVIVLGIALLLANLIYELFIPVLNTPDIVDAYFGFTGTILGFLFLFLVYKSGLNPNPIATE